MTADTVGNLHTPGDGIFGTHVTWDDIEHDMTQALGTSATFGPNKTVENIGEGNGFASRICLIDPDWQNVQEGEELPKKFIGKLVTSMALLAFSKKIAEEKGVKNFLNLDATEHFDHLIRKAHNTEVHVYHLLDKYDVHQIPRAKIYNSRKFSEENPLKGFLLMEYMDDLALVHIFTKVKPEDMHQALRGLAAMEALTFKLTEEELSVFCSRPLTELFSMLFTDDSKQSITQFLGKYESKKHGEAVQQLMKVVPDLVHMEWSDAIPDQLGMKRVLCHGDLWSTNILWRKNNDKHVIAAIVDFQTSHLGNPAGDLSRLFCSNLGGEDRVECTENLLQTFYNFLLEELGPLPAPYSLEQLKEAYRRYQPISGFMVVPMFGSDLFLEKIPQEEKEEAKDILDEKLGALVEEVLVEHKRNTEIRAQSK